MRPSAGANCAWRSSACTGRLRRAIRWRWIADDRIDSTSRCIAKREPRTTRFIHHQELAPWV
jgi:hypothetical protein